MRPPLLKTLPGSAWGRPEARLRRIRALARLLDTAYVVPGTRYRIGLDPILGLLPGLGDFLSLGLSAYLLHEARHLGVSRRTLARMGLNLLLDATVGTVPLLGDVFDVAYKANARNLALLEKDLQARGIIPIDVTATATGGPGDPDRPAPP
jgi:hypothetical protein